MLRENAATEKFYLDLFVDRAIRYPNHSVDCHWLYRPLWHHFHRRRHHLHRCRRHTNFAVASPTNEPLSNMLSTSLPTVYRNKQSNRLIYKRDLEFGTFHQLKPTHDPISLAEKNKMSEKNTHAQVIVQQQLISPWMGS